MASSDSLATVWAPRVLSILRIVIGFLYIWHGTQKFFGFPGGNAQPLDMMTLRGASAILETFGGALILLGLFTRPVAFILSGHMAFAYFMVHAPQNFWPILNRGELAIMFCVTFLYRAAAGGGPLSFDALFRGRRR